MNSQEEARELATRQRHKDEHLRKTELMRSIAESETAAGKELQKEARETMRQHRHKKDRLEENVLRRSANEVGLPTKPNSER